MEQKKVVYIAGPVLDENGSCEEFSRYVDAVSDLGYIVLRPTCLPKGLTRDQFIKIRTGMIAAADAVLFASGWDEDIAAREDWVHCVCINKPVITPPTGRDVKPYWLREALEEGTTWTVPPSPSRH